MRGVSFSIPDGASVAIIGKSGSGKSTLMHAMSGLDKPQKGQVLIDGIDILKLSARDTDKFRATQIGFVFQSFFLEPNESCYNNISLALEMAGTPRNKRKELILQALADVNLSEKAKSNAVELSGGQKQRLAIARAIVNRPKIIFADEPTGNLDSANSQIVEDLLFDRQKNHHTTLILVTHNQELAARCQIQIRIKDGEIEQFICSPEITKKLKSEKTVAKSNLAKRSQA